MKTFVIGSLSLVALVNAESEIKRKWAAFKKEFGKTYDHEEDAKRFGIFIDNLEDIEKMATMDPHAQYSHMTPYADMTREEFTSRNQLAVTDTVLEEHARAAESFKIDMSFEIPTEFDWRPKGAVTPVKNQAQCGSCWAFATVANIEGQNFLQNQELISLSEQELVDCSKSDQGCGGGLPSLAYKDLLSTKTGMELESDYSYTAANGQCKATSAKEKVFLSNWTSVSKDEDEIAAALMKYGPLAIGINASWMQFYSGGISDPWFASVTCNPKGLDHGVTIVGFGEENGKKFWTIKNSWGTGWGEKGYYRIVRGKGTCGVNQMVTSAEVAKKSEDIFV